MNSRSNDHPGQDELPSARTFPRSEPLLGRIDPLLRESTTESTMASMISVSNGLVGLL